MITAQKNLIGDKTVPFIIQSLHPNITQIVEQEIEGIKWEKKV